MYSALSQGTRQSNKTCNELSFQQDDSTTTEELRVLQEVASPHVLANHKTARAATARRCSVNLQGYLNRKD